MATNSLHRIQAAYIPISPRQQSCPAAAESPGVDEVESRGWGRRAPQSPSSSSFGAPQGNNKIYRSDEVFLIEESNTNDQRITPIPYKITKDISRTQFDKPTASYSTNPPTASQSTCPQVQPSRAARYRMPRHPRTCRAIS